MNCKSCHSLIIGLYNQTEKPILCTTKWIKNEFIKIKEEEKTNCYTLKVKTYEYITLLMGNGKWQLTHSHTQKKEIIIKFVDCVHVLFGMVYTGWCRGWIRWKMAHAVTAELVFIQTFLPFFSLLFLVFN